MRHRWRRSLSQHRRLVRLWYAWGTAALTIACSVPSHAELNVPIATRVLTFLIPAPTGPTPVAIVFAPDNPASVAEANAIEHAVGSGVKAGGAIIRTRRVPVTALDGLRGYHAAFVTTGLRNQHDDIAAAAKRHAVVTITSDASCVQTARCVVGIGAGARVQITVSRAAARAVNARFGSAFLMLVKEI